MPPPRELAALLRSRKDELLERWAARVRARLAEPLREPLLLDSMPEYLETLALGLERSTDASAPSAGPSRAVAAAHGLQRRQLGLALDQVYGEYRALRDVILEAAVEAGLKLDSVGATAFADLVMEGATEAARAFSAEARGAEEVLELGDAFLELDADWRIVRVNQNQERLSRRPREETLGRVFWDVWPDTVGPASQYWREYRRVMEERVPREFDAWYEPLDLWTSVSAYPVSGGGIAVFFRDATRRKHAERQLADTLALLEGIFARAPVALATVDRALHLVRANERLADLSDAPAGDLVGRSFGEALPGLAPALEPSLRAVLADGEPRLDEEVSGTTARGAGHFLASHFAVRDATGAIFLAGSVLVDITQRKEAEAELRAARAFEQQLIGIVSHDLRNPLNAIQLGASTLLARSDLPERHHRTLERIRDSAVRATRLIRDLLDLTRARLTGAFPVEPRPMDLRSVIDDVVEEVGTGWRDREVRVISEGETEGEWDPSRLAQVGSNLLTNALKYGAPGRAITIRIDGRAPGRVTLAVHNEGAPLSPELLAAPFTPWQRAARADTMRGVGLGLFIVDGIARAHGGIARVTSSPEAGTTFTVELPRRSPPTPGANGSPGPAEA